MESDQIDGELLDALVDEYKHPWYKLEKEVRFKAERKEWKMQIKQNIKQDNSRNYSHNSQDDIFSDRASVHGSKNEP